MKKILWRRTNNEGIAPKWFVQRYATNFSMWK